MRYIFGQLLSNYSRYAGEITKFKTEHNLEQRHNLRQHNTI